MKQMGFSTILVVKILDTNSSVRTNKGRHVTSVSYRDIPISCRAFRDNYEPGQNLREKSYKAHTPCPLRTRILT